MKSREFHKIINELLVANLCPDDEVFVGTDGGQLVIMTSDSDISGIEEELCFRRVTLQELDDVLLETNFEDTFENRFSHMACDFEIACYNGEAAVVVTGIPATTLYQLA